MPMIEAMAAGVPVLSADASCLPEICGNGALHFGQKNPSEMASLAAKLLTDRTLNETMRQRGFVRCMSFSWEKTADQMLRIFEDVTQVN
jgi:glycosyltransferase involved in cell wall biosynthesis